MRNASNATTLLGGLLRARRFLRPVGVTSTCRTGPVTLRADLPLTLAVAWASRSGTKETILSQGPEVMPNDLAVVPEMRPLHVSARTPISNADRKNPSEAG